MSEIELMIRVSMLPPHLKEEVSDFVDFLLNKYVEQSQQNNPLQFGMINGISEQDRLNENASEKALAEEIKTENSILADIFKKRLKAESELDE